MRKNYKEQIELIINRKRSDGKERKWNTVTLTYEDTARIKRLNYIMYCKIHDFTRTYKNQIYI